MKGFAFGRRFRSASSLLPTLTRNNRELLAFLNSFVVRFDSDGSTVTLPGDMSVAGSITTEGWIAPTLLNSWANHGSGFRDVGYKKTSDGTVHIKGLVKDGTAVDAIIFTLPVGYRPSETVISASHSDVPGVVDLRVKSNGDVFANTGGNTTWTSVEVSFQI